MAITSEDLARCPSHDLPERATERLEEKLGRLGEIKEAVAERQAEIERLVEAAESVRRESQDYVGGLADALGIEEPHVGEGGKIYDVAGLDKDGDEEQGSLSEDEDAALSPQEQAARDLAQVSS